MADLSNPWPNWGESGELPPDGFFYEGGDQVNEKHLDSLWNTSDSQTQELIDGITQRVADIDNNVILDSGLSASTGTGTREVDVTASSDGAYVAGQKTGSVSAVTLTLSANGGSTVRTDSVYVTTNGSVGVTEGTTTVSSDRFKIAEVDVDPSDVINTIRNLGRRLTQTYRSESQPDNTLTGDVWTDLSTNRTKVYQGGGFRTLLTDQDSVSITGGDGLKGGGSLSLDGGSTTLNVEPVDFAGTNLSDDGADNLQLDIGSAVDFASNDATNVGTLGVTTVNGTTVNGSTVDASSELGAPTYLDTGSLPTAPEGAIAFVQSEDTIYVQVD